MIQLETQEAGTGEWFPVIIYQPGTEGQRAEAVNHADAFRSLGLYSRITGAETDAA